MNIGAYQSSHSVATATSNLLRCLASVYSTPVLDVHIKCIYSNTTPVAPYRGAGRPEANLILERLIDVAAHDLGIDPADLRRRNLVPPSAIPYSAPNGMVYDSGNFPAVFERALALADYHGFSSRRAEALKRGCVRGIGIACYLEIAGGAPVEDMRLDLTADGSIVIHSGLQSNGQGHATVFPALVAEKLGIPPERVMLGDGDSALVPEGMGSVGSRSLTVGGAAAIVAVEALKERVRYVGAELLEVAVADVSYDNGSVRIPGTDRSVSLTEIAQRAGPLFVMERGHAPLTFPNGCHIAEIEIDPETGASHVVSFVGVDDVGRCFNHALVEGQIHGGIAQGLGQVLLEQAQSDPSTGQLLTGSFMDYSMPRAGDLPKYRAEVHEVRCTTNPLGTKGAGEAGTTGALAAGYNALMNALEQVGITAFNMPATPPRIWEALARRHSGIILPYGPR